MSWYRRDKVLKSVVLKKKELLALGALDYDALYQQVKADNFPFYLWTEWALQQLYLELDRRKNVGKCNKM